MTKRSSNVDGSAYFYNRVQQADGSSTTSCTEKNADGSKTITKITADANGQAKVTMTEVNADGSKAVYKFKTALLDSDSSSDGKSSVSDDLFKIGFSGYFKLIAYKSDGSVVILPSEIKDDGKTYAVDTISKKLFYKNKKITSVQIGKYVTSIGSKAFKNAKKLKEIVIYSDKLVTVGKKAFAGIAKNAVIKIKASKKQYKRIVKLIKASGVAATVKFERIK